MPKSGEAKRRLAPLITARGDWIGYFSVIKPGRVECGHSDNAYAGPQLGGRADVEWDGDESGLHATGHRMKQRSMAIVKVIQRIAFTATYIGLAWLAVSGSHAAPNDDWVQEYVVQFLSGKEDNPFGAGVYLGSGLVITAAHVVGSTRGVRIGAEAVPARLVKRGSFPQMDLSLISVDQGKMSASLRERRMPLCQEQSPAGAPVVLAAPQGITRTSIASPMVIPPDLRTKYPTLITDGATDGKSGSGVFDADRKCLLGILSLKIYNVVYHQNYASYFVPASTIQSFIPAGVQELPPVRAWPQAPH